MKGAGDQLLAGPGLPRDQDGDVARRHLADHRDHLPDRGRVADDPLEPVRGVELASQPRVLVPQQHGLGRPVHEVAEHLEVQRLLDKVVRPALEGRLGRRYVTVGRDHQRFDIRLVLLRKLQHPQAGCLVLHHEIRHDDVEVAVAELILGSGEAVDDRAHVPWFAQRLCHHIGVLDLVVDDKHLRVKSGLPVLTCHVATIVPLPLTAGPPPAGAPI